MCLAKYLVLVKKESKRRRISVVKITRIMLNYMINIFIVIYENFFSKRSGAGFPYEICPQSNFKIDFGQSKEHMKAPNQVNF